MKTFWRVCFSMALCTIVTDVLATETKSYPAPKLLNSVVELKFLPIGEDQSGDTAENEIANLRKQLLGARLELEARQQQHRPGSQSLGRTNRTGFRIGNSQRIATFIDASQIEREDRTLVVVTTSGVSTPVDIVAYDPRTGVSLLQPTGGETLPDDLTGINIADADPVFGQQAIMVRFRKGGHNAAVIGHVASEIYRPKVFQGEVAELDFDVSRVAGGGPVLGDNGNLLGIAMPNRSYGDDQTMGWMITPECLRQLVAFADAGNTGQMPVPFLGIAFDDDENQVVVLRVVDHSPADRAQIKKGDIIQSINGNKIQSADDVWTEIQTSTVGSEVTLRLLRDEQEIGVKASLERRSNDQSKQTEVAITSDKYKIVLPVEVNESILREIDNDGERLEEIVSRGGILILQGDDLPGDDQKVIKRHIAGEAKALTDVRDEKQFDWALRSLKSPEISAIPPDVNKRLDALDRRIEDIGEKLDQLLGRTSDDVKR